MALVLSAILKLDGGAFTTPLGKAVEGMKLLANVAMDVGGKLKDAFDMGGALQDLSAQTGEAPGQLMILKQAFTDTGVGAETLGQTLGIMRKSLSGINESGQPTNKMFERLGLNMDSLKGMGAQQQFETIGAAIRNLASPTEQTAAAMEIFGRGGNRMLSFLKDPEAISVAAQSLGNLPGIMNRSAAAFDTISDRMGRIKEKTKGFWAGIAEGLAPVFDEVTKSLDGIDLTGIGQMIGDFIGTVTQMFRQNDWGILIGNGLMIGIKEAANVIVKIFMDIGKVLWDVLSYPIAGFATGFQYLIEGVMKGLSKIPGINKALGLENFEMSSVKDMWKNNLEDIQALAKNGEGIKLFDASEEKKQIAEAYSAASITFQQKKRDLYQSSNQAAPTGTERIDLPIKSISSAASEAITTDALKRIGGSIGGSAPDARLTDLTAQHVGLAKEMRNLLSKIASRDGSDMQARWA